MATERPNILFIMADQLTAPALPFYGHEKVKAPHLSSLARNGVVFENAYCNSPLCAPSRFSMMSGQLPSRIGAYDNAALFSAEIPTLAHYLRDLGYYTCLVGKMHFVGPDQLHGFEDRITTDIYPSDFGWTPDWENFGVRPSWYHNMMSVVQAGTCESSNQLDFDEEVAFQAGRKIHDLARGRNEHPFMLLVSFTHPHDPFTITPEYWNRYEHSEIDLPNVPAMPFDQLDPHSRRIYHVCDMGQYRQTEERVRNARHAYYGMISYIDDKVGQLVRTLEATGLKENTIIIFISDHGEMLGERGMWYKMSFFEWSARVPMLFYAPERFRAGRVETPVSLVDLLPTLVELSNEGQAVDYVDRLDGNSLRPLLEGREIAEPPPVRGEMLGEGVVAPMFMIRRGRYKYIFTSSDPEQLYDVEADPNELNNLAGQAAYEPVRQAFHEEMTASWDPEAVHREVAASQRRRQLVDRALRRGKFTPWDFQPHQKASQRFMRNHLDLNVLEKTSRFPTPDVPPPDGTAVEEHR